MCRRICFLLVIVLLGGLAACYEAPAGGGPGATPSVMSALSPTASTTAVPIATATPTATLEPTPTPAPEGLNSLPSGIIAVRNPDGTWGVGIDEGAQTKAIPGILIDTAGFHLTSGGGQIDIATAEMIKRLKVGQNSPFQIYNEAESAILFAYDDENKVMIDAAKVLQPDNSNVENYIKYDTIDDWLKSARLEKMVITPFDPATTYFPDLTKIYTTDWNNINSGHYTDSEFNFDSPFGNLPENMQSSFRIVNFVNIGNDKSYGWTEQIYNPKDDSFTLIHIPVDNYKPEISTIISSILPLGGRYLIPVYFAGDLLNMSRYPWARDTITWLKTNGYMDASGNMSEIKVWIDEWLTTGYLSPEMENIPVLTRTRKFPTK